MKKLLLLAISALLSSAVAAEIKPYIGAGFGVMATPEHPEAKNALGMTLKAGAIGFVDAMPGVGTMIELNKSVTDLSDHSEFEDALTFAGYVTYDIVIPNSQFSIRPKFGIIIPNASDEINSRDLTFSSGIGGKMNFNKQIDLFVEYVVLGESVTHYSVGAEFNF